jgi:hypothetical protein
VSSSVMLISDLLMAVDYTFGVQLKGSLSYRLPSNLQFDLNYTDYKKGQKTILSAPNQERGFSFSVPLQSKNFSLYSRVSLSQKLYGDYKTTNSEFLLSANLKGVSSNITTSLTFPDPQHITASSNYALSFSIPGHFIMMPAFLYDYNQKKVMSYRCNLEKPLLGKGYLNIFYDHNIVTKLSSLNVGLRYDFSFMQASLASRLSKNSNSFTQTARGSLLFDAKNRYVGTSGTSMVGRGSFAFLAYLDLNGDGIREKNEPIIKGLNVRVNGGRVVKNEKDSTIRVLDLQPYTSYLVELDKNSLENIAWQIKNKTLSVFADPNQIKMIEVPIAVMSEAAGTVNKLSKSGTSGLARVYVNFYLNGKTLVGRTLTESDGYFSYMGLQPGNYIVRMDSAQLTKIKMVATPDFKAFKVKESKDGDYIEGLDFTLQSTLKDSIVSTTTKVEPPRVPEIEKKTSDIEKPAPTKATQPTVKESNSKAGNPSDTKQDDGNIDVTKAISVNKKSDTTQVEMEKLQPLIANDNQAYSVRYGSFKSENDAHLFQRKITTTSGKPTMIILEDGVYTVWIEDFSTYRNAREFLSSLEKNESKPNIKEELAPPKQDISDSVSGDSNNNLMTAVKKERKEPNKPLINNMATTATVKPRSLPVPKSGKTDQNQDDNLTVIDGQKFSVQVGEFIFGPSALTAYKKISAFTRLPVIVEIRRGFYNLVIEEFQTRKEAKLFVDQLKQTGYNGTVIKDNI